MTSVVRGGDGVVTVFSGVEQLLSKFFVFLGCSFPDALARKSGFVGFFFPLCLLTFLSCWLLQLQVSAIWGKKKTLRIHHSFLGPEVPSWWICLLSTIQSSYVCFMFRVSVILSVKNKDSMYFWSSQKWKFPLQKLMDFNIFTDKCNHHHNRF